MTSDPVGVLIVISDSGINLVPNEVADQALDTCGAYGGAVMPLTGRDWKVAPTSTGTSA